MKAKEGGKKNQDSAEEAKEVEEEGISIKKDTCLEILWAAQERHMKSLASDMVSLEDQKKEIEESLADKRKECFQWAKAMDVPHPFEEDFYQKDPLVRFLEELIKEKKNNLECPVCLEVIDFYCQHNFCNQMSGGKRTNLRLQSVPCHLCLL